MKKLLFIILCSGLIGCAMGEANRYYLKEKFSAKDIEQVEVLQSNPERPYIVIADFQVSNVKFKYLRKRAAEIGADAVIVTCTGGWYSTSEVWADEDRYSNSCSGVIGTAIKYTME